MGTTFSSLTVLKLRSNAFFGGLLFGLSNLTLLHILDLTKNNLSGCIPSTLGDLIAMSQKEKLSLSINASAYIEYVGISITKVVGQDKLIVKSKNQDLESAKSLPLVVSINLSNNNFTGEFPNQITKLQSLVFLNLSRNHINGSIPQDISMLHELQSLDLSCNNLWYHSFEYAFINIFELFGYIKLLGKTTKYNCSKNDFSLFM